MRPSFGTKLPQIVTHICQKAIFTHALEYVNIEGSNVFADCGYDSYKLIEYSGFRVPAVR